jgi:hypothetical protein
VSIEPERTPTTIGGIPTAACDGTTGSSGVRLDRALREGMTQSETYAAIAAQGTAGGPSGVRWSVSSVISNEYPGMAIDLFFDRDDALVLRLSSWNLRKREATEFYLPIGARDRSNDSHERAAKRMLR